MEYNPKYSVIIPVYNAEKTLERCVNSLLCQNYMDAEIILVNDGSTDSSGEICGGYAASSEQIRYISRENGGVSSARNAGLAIAAGRFVLFVDSDDAVAEDYFGSLDILDREEAYDLIWFSHKRIGKGKTFYYTQRPVSVCSTAACGAVFSNALYRKTLNPLWNKRYTNRIIQEKGLRFPEELSVAEDTVFNLQYAVYCRNCRISDAVLYHFYIDNRPSLSRGIREDLQEQFRIYDEKVLEIIGNAQLPETERMQYLQAFRVMKLRSVYSEAKRMHMAGKEKRIRRSYILQACNELNRENGALPNEVFCSLLKIPVRLKLTALIDFLGYLLARSQMEHRRRLSGIKK